MPVSDKSVVLGWAAVCAVVLLVVSGTYTTVNHSERVANAEAEAGDRQRESDRVGALGRVEPYSEVINLGAGSTPDRLDTLLVGHGDPVRKGQVLGFLGGYGEQIAQRDMFERQLEETRRRLEPKPR